MKHNVDVLISSLFAASRGNQPDPRDVLRRVAKHLSYRPDLYQFAIDIADRNIKPPWNVIRELIFKLRSAKQDQPGGGVIEDQLLEALQFGEIANRERQPPKEPVDEWSAGSLHNCDFCWRPGKWTKINGLPVIICQEHRRNSPGGQRLIRMAKHYLAEQATRSDPTIGVRKLLAEVQAERITVSRDYDVLAAARERYCLAPGWADFHDDRELDPMYDDYLVICAAAWDRVVERHRQLHAARPNAGRPRKWTNEDIAAASTGRLRRDAAPSRTTIWRRAKQNDL